MDTYEATEVVLSRIQSLDPDNASRITGYILVQDQGEKEMIRLAFSPDPVLVSFVNQAKSCLGISSNSNCSTPSTPPSPFSNNDPISNSNRVNPFPQTSPRIVIPNTRFHFKNPSSPSSPWSSRSSRSAYYAAVVNGSTNTASGSSSSSLSSPFYGNNTSDLSDEIGNIQVQDQMSFLDDSSDPILSPSGRSDSVVFPYGNCEENSAAAAAAPHHQQFHRRSYSVNDAFLGGEDGGNLGLGWRPCLYFAKGLCKNGNTCEFLHSGGGFGGGDSSTDCARFPIVGPGSPGNTDGFDELLKLKALQQQRFALQLMASGAPPPFAYDKCMNFLNEGQRSATAAASMMGDEFNKFGRRRPNRSDFDFSALGLGGSASSAARQIYLTFPADSTFKEEDVSNYFSIYGPVQDVRIPYQQKRMFGFVTFVYPETVKLILAKGNPHFVCDSRVLVKPYKEKGKVPDKKQHQQQQHLETGEFFECSPPGLDSRDMYDLPRRARIFYNAQEMMLRRKLEQEVELKQAIELQGRRLMNLQLMDLNNHHHNLQPNSGMLPGVRSPGHPQSPFNQNHIFPPDDINLDVPEDLVGNQEAVISSSAPSTEQVLEKCTGNLDSLSNSDTREESSKVEESDALERSASGQESAET